MNNHNLFQVFFCLKLLKVVVASMAFLWRIFFSQIGIIPLGLYFKIS